MGYVNIVQCLGVKRTFTMHGCMLSAIIATEKCTFVQEFGLDKAHHNLYNVKPREVSRAQGQGAQWKSMSRSVTMQGFMAISATG